jgi:hypothetical protein
VTAFPAGAEYQMMTRHAALASAESRSLTVAD